jgi:hypothetical protein
MALIQSNTLPAPLSDGILQTENALDGTLQRVEDNLGNQSAMSLSTNALSLNRNILTNFVPVFQTGGTLTINASNSDSVNCSVYGLTGATQIIFANLFDGFSMSFIQLDTTDTQFVAGGGYTLRAKNSHTRSSGQYAMTSVYFHSNIIYLGGDTKA